ncbi:MAG: C40 family peptidase [Brachybacterium sp.]|uniref:C40 family peptidase n=1 Tax=Brachybacterium sp. Z12 TaxID=2759167 RepID=UPI00185FF2F9|nr:NlpC/P60 family protein [Brachybacterium sp. Z12]QNN82202.1 C40 family peptidase [Brachybacterium sp. Z12]
MAHQNTHRSAGRAITPLTTSHRAARAFGGSAVLGTVLLGAAFGGGSSAMADDTALAGADEAPSTSQSAPAETTSQGSSSASQGKLRQGDSGQSVETLQASLNAHGADLPETGYFGSMTDDAVQAFQSENGLQVDGVVGPETHGALGGDSSGPAPVDIPSAGASAVPASASSASGSSIVDAARSAIGSPYSWGGSSLSGMDCSGLVAYAYGAAGIDAPRTSSELASQGRSISQSEAQPGDLVVWPGHVAIYAGDGQIIDASGSQQQVVERGIWGSPTGFVTYR